MNTDNDLEKGDYEETHRAVLKMIRKERKQIKKEVKHEERQKDEERKKLELKFGPTDNRVRIISREFASKLIDSPKSQTNNCEFLQLTPNDFPSLDQIVYKSKNVTDMNCSTFVSGVATEPCASSSIDINLSKPTETIVPILEPMNISGDKNYNVLGDPNDIDMSALNELDFIFTEMVPKKPKRKRGKRGAGSRKKKPRSRIKNDKVSENCNNTNGINLSESKELNQSESKELNESGSKEFTVSEDKELNLTEAKEFNLFELKKLNDSEAKELNLSHFKELHLSQPKRLNLFGSNQFNLYKPEELNIPGFNKFNLCEPEELSIPGPSKFNLCEPEELTIPRPSKFNSSVPNEINLIIPNEPVMKKTKRVNFGPVTVNILDIVQKSKLQLKKEANNVRQRAKKLRKREAKRNERYEGNMLDASQPDRQRGKHREFAKEKKPSKLKQLIQRDEAEAAEEVAEAEEKAEKEPYRGKPKYSEFHINYSNNVITEELDSAVTAFLMNIVQFQENLYERDQIKGSAKRRYFVGFRIVRKFLLLKKIKILVVSPDIKAKRKGDTLDNMINNIVSLAAASEIPYVFALSRRKLGQITLKNVPISCVAVADYDGTEKEFEAVLQLIQVTRDEYQKTKPKPLDAQEELTKEIIDDFLSFV